MLRLRPRPTLDGFLHLDHQRLGRLVSSMRRRRRRHPQWQSPSPTRSAMSASKVQGPTMSHLGRARKRPPSRQSSAQTKPLTRRAPRPPHLSARRSLGLLASRASYN